MPGELVPWHVGGHHFKHLAGGASGTGTDGVAQGHFIAAHGIQLAGDHCHLLRRDFTFIGAAEYAGHVTAHADAMLPGGVHDRHETLQAFTDRAIDVALRECLGRGGEHRDFLDPGRHRVLESAQVGGQGTIGHAGFALDPCEHFGGAGHLRHPLG
ncbi:hypothetical protein D3C73_1288810 [compost metagenome]